MANQNESSSQNSRSSKAWLNIRSGITLFVVSPLSRQSVYRAAETAQLKCVGEIRGHVTWCGPQIRGTEKQGHLQRTDVRMAAARKAELSILEACDAAYSALPIDNRPARDKPHGTTGEIWLSPRLQLFPKTSLLSFTPTKLSGPL